MSQHPSLKSSKIGKKQRTVLKRYERFSTLKEKGILKDNSSVFGMPKLKIIRMKLKKEKPKEKPEEGQAPVTEVASAQKGGAPKGAVPKGGAPKVEKEQKK